MVSICGKGVREGGNEGEGGRKKGEERGGMSGRG